MDRRKKERAGIIKPGSGRSSENEIQLTQEEIEKRGPSKYTLEGRDLINSMKKSLWDISGAGESQITFESKKSTEIGEG